MDPLSGCPLGFSDLLAQACKVSRKDRRNDFDDIVFIFLFRPLTCDLQNCSCNASDRASADRFTMEQS
jgi:hypothetical protein